MHSIVTPLRSRAQTHQGIVLPVVLVLLVVMSFVGLMAARRSATVEEVTNNARVNQVAWLSAESALRYCEAVVIDMVDETDCFEDEVRDRVQTTVITDAKDKTAVWRNLANWADNSAALIKMPVAEVQASAALQGAPAPRCIAQAMPDDRYLISARGLSAGAAFNNDGQLLAGAEVWLQSIVSPGVPLFNGIGNE